MPGSAYSAATSSHGGSSSSSRRARTRSYHKVAHTSQVDESLFGTSHKDVLLTEKRNGQGDEIHIETQAQQRNTNRKRRGNPNGKKETVQVITKDLIRNLIVPEEDPSGNSLVLHSFNFDRIKRASRVLTQEERDVLYELKKAEKEEALNAVQDRKNFMKQMDLTRRKNEKLNDLEEEAKERAQHLLGKANDQRQEQEDEIKYLNELILNAKCHAIRDAQILEKGVVRNEMNDEEKRLDVMMEVDRVNALKMQDEIENTRKDERLLGAMKLMDQIQENEQEKLLDLEKKDMENIAMQKYLEKLCGEEAEQLDKKRSAANQLREDLNMANNEMLRRKDMIKEQEYALDMKVLDFQKEKAEREAAYEKEVEQKRIEKEREVARLRALQERARDEQSERDALRAKRQQEESEREWRRKEAGEAMKKSEQEALLKAARSRQTEQKEHFLAVQAQRDRSEFEKVLGAQKEQGEKDKREEEEHVHRRRTYADDVRTQIREKEQHRITARNAFFEEGTKLNEEAKLRRSKLDEVKQKKLNELRSVGIHEKYLTQVERKINQPQNVQG